ncbi:unnamed protein product [Brachionus calyciflorus]|uniref:Phosphoserine phosphatase n=1 Tax=Brachionus calyciflorus TaxID=104777 RepID=A0A813M3B0_9BILA|nr:unnamed protein product [Brachionus calyciflorus]
MNRKSKVELVSLWKSADCVCFDVDSTVCVNEAIDDLAEYAGVGSQVQELTLKAMGGNMTFKQALQMRLSIIRPSKNIIDGFNRSDKCQLTPKIKDLINTLHDRNIPVYLVSGGFRVFINPVAELLNIKTERVFANTIKFDHNDEYENFDESELTCESGGKGKVIQLLKDTHGYNRVVMIGDGWTDFESCPPADGFIGFGGNAVREKVKSNSEWFVHDFQELIDVLIN